jgi:serine/threonine-protein kinase BUR1
MPVMYLRYGMELAQLLDALLKLDPNARLSAADALDHDWFWTDPLPAKPEESVLPVVVRLLLG